MKISAESCRATQLYRTVLHELGHWIQWREMVIRRANNEIGFDLKDKYFSLPIGERETFAHNYAESIRKKLLTENVIPFPKIH